MAAGLSAHRAAIDAFSRQAQQSVEAGLQDFFRTRVPYGPPLRVDLSPPGPNDARTLARALLPPRPSRLVAPAFVQRTMPLLIADDLPRIAPEPATAKPSDREIAVAARLKKNLTPELLNNFSLFLYVSSAAKGPFAQHLYVFRKDGNGGLVLLHDWLASTGRAREEVSPQGRRSFTATPAGYYEFDPARMYKSYFSQAWNGSMPYAMFFNWERQGEQTGVAIHAATGDDIDRLGSRASAGCIHLSPEHARELYYLIRGQYRGSAPRFAYDESTRTMNNRGALMRGEDGQIEMADGYRVLTVIENFGGRKRIAALD
jgi:hypothetical protein